MANNFSHGLPRLSPNGGGQPVSVASPLNDLQITALVAAILLAREPAADFEDTKTRNVQAERAVVRALDLLGHASYKVGRGLVEGTILSAIQQGRSDQKEALEAEEAAARAAGQPEKKIITNLEG